MKSLGVITSLCLSLFPLVSAITSTSIVCSAQYGPKAVTSIKTATIRHPYTITSTITQHVTTTTNVFASPTLVDITAKDTVSANAHPVLTITADPVTQTWINPDAGDLITLKDIVYITYTHYYPVTVTATYSRPTPMLSTLNYVRRVIKSYPTAVTCVTNVAYIRTSTLLLVDKTITSLHSSTSTQTKHMTRTIINTSLLTTTFTPTVVVESIRVWTTIVTYTLTSTVNIPIPTTTYVFPEPTVLNGDFATPNFEGWYTITTGFGAKLFQTNNTSTGDWVAECDMQGVVVDAHGIITSDRCYLRQDLTYLDSSKNHNLVMTYHVLGNPSTIKVQISIDDKVLFDSRKPGFGQDGAESLVSVDFRTNSGSSAKLVIEIEVFIEGQHTVLLSGIGVISMNH